MSAAEYVPERRTLSYLREAVQGCHGCPSTRTRPRRSSAKAPRHAEVMCVGEQPGDQEDLAGRPFVGPAGRLLDEALAEAGIDRSRAYVTNAVKHFKWQARGQAAHPPEAELVASRRLPAVARGGARRRPAAGARLPRRDGSPVAARQATSG